MGRLIPAPGQAATPTPTRRPAAPDARTSCARTSVDASVALNAPGDTMVHPLILLHIYQRLYYRR